MKTARDICDFIALSTVVNLMTKRYKYGKGLSILMTNIAYDMIMKGEY